MFYKKNILLTVLLLCMSTMLCSQPKRSQARSSRHIDYADLIIFSYDRPILLKMLLESLAYYTHGIDTVVIVYRASNMAYQKAYAHVQAEFRNTVFLQQGTDPRQDFKPLTLHALSLCKNDYILFAVDDIVVKDYIDMKECIDALRKTNAYGFFLRLGENISYCYPHACQQSLPPLRKQSPTILSWSIGEGAYDWNYCCTVDMTLYKKSEIAPAFKQMVYHSPNQLEARWQSYNPHVKHGLQKRLGLCFTTSKIVNIPLNCVQKDFENKNMNLYTNQELLKKFNDGLKIDIHQFYKIDNNAPHMEYHPTFIIDKKRDIPKTQDYLSYK